MMRGGALADLYCILWCYMASNLYVLYIFSPSVLLHATLLAMGWLVETTRAWAMGPVFAMESTYTTS